MQRIFKIMKQFVNKFICILLSIITLWLFTNASINQHSHIINGTIVTHAHPYKIDKNSNSPFQSHKHSNFLLFILDQISNPITILIITIGLSAILFRKIFSVLIQYISITPNTDYLYFGTFRAPPSLV